MKSSSLASGATNKAVVAFGSNLGDRLANIEAALVKMRENQLHVLKLSPLYETMPMYYDDQDPFLNGVCQIETTLEPLQLLDILQSIENDLGRKRLIDKGPRTIDLDIILYNQAHFKHPRLNIPHILMLEREFVLRPLADILPNAHLPADFSPTAPHRQISQLLEALPEKDATMSPVTTLKPEMPLIRTRDVSRKTHVMAILNLTPDSFSDGGLHTAKGAESIKTTVANFIAAGASIIDIGGQSTRPKADYLGPHEELNRILPIVRLIRQMKEAENVAISIDTFHSVVARETILAGADIINDVSAGLLDSRMLPTVAELGKTIVLMHMRGDPHTMTKLTDYPDGVISGVARELCERVQAALASGIRPWRVILDPGLGFAKNQQQNLELLRSLAQLREQTEYSPALRNFPWLMGPSRKGFIGNVTDVSDASKRSYGTAAAVTASIEGGADIVRIHDVREMVQVTKMADAIYRRP
ncbi:dihydropteroate synthase [Cladophialophora bantiana CBS 173.52]|uniref:Folic acid synthesis protein FOL1 n=1 Tax=Cladophialophora bantiana (strain ATCC 10958 / CBS 173.52 / CDC B-1940 / NIH 8579) TaxID=1442370 RepID=A0A0D2FZF0_CLAB1|nr:dihydropteroate synthase [Cladophialophora bantiana CBS 173.52]KIW91847.1 dihydropteroate synthase [Cladophialophora bantiana CBS 173.52]